ncbi:MAG: glucose-6-phosphate dehydrogenase [Coriobacteriia bacterium]|nr:glucose-6-phosphate dehydrogenase [Coriobacteriia bacterium]MBN2841302.1 glucose-6-phosphate dehydrogenase [Coriobacteriia bacterium]
MDHGSQPATILVVFGATGDLMARKIVPSLFHLERQGLLHPRLRVIGFSRRDWSDTDFRDRVQEILSERYKDTAPLEPFLERFSYRRGTFADSAAYDALAQDIGGVAAGWGGCVDKLFYLAVPPENYQTILGNLSSSGLTSVCDPESGYTRVLIEKPFGHDVDSSKALDELLASLFREEQIYRIDHYLAKEMLQGILAFRFHNDLLESTWNRHGVERIDISLLETIGVEKRGRFYDGVGALRDVGQNHLLQMLALVTMDQPLSLDADGIRTARATLLETLRPPLPHEVARSSYRAQYEGYRDIEGVDPDSTTETYFRLETTMAGPRWAGVPVSFESGKRIAPGPLKRIVVTFRHRHPCLCGDGPHLTNRVVFTLEPDDTISISFWAKRPGFEYEVEERAFDFALYEKTEKLQYVEEYAKLLYDAVRGDQTSFVSTDEIRAMWRFTDPVVDAWRDGIVPLETYDPDTQQPVERARTAIAAAGARSQIGILGLGKMGAGIARNLLDHGWEVVGWNRTTGVARAMEPDGLIAADSPEGLVATLRPPRTVWLMVPAGHAVDAVLFGAGDTPGLADLLEAGDVVIDGGNSRFTEDGPRAKRLRERGIGFLDCGTSGGPSGARHGACLMIGGDRETFERSEAVFADIAVQDGYRFFDGVGSGHFVKMVHNGIEYGMMQAIAEGFSLMHRSERDLDLEAVADVYQHASVIESRLVGWLRDAYSRHGDDLGPVSGTVGHTGEGAWTVETAQEAGVPMPVIEAALRFRIDSDDAPSYTGQVVQALRNEFGGHGLGT